jgi:hypothetical protein
MKEKIKMQHNCFFPPTSSSARNKGLYLKLACQKRKKIAK